MASIETTVKVTIHPELSQAIYRCLHTLNRSHLYAYMNRLDEYIDIVVVEQDIVSCGDAI